VRVLKIICLVLSLSWLVQAQDTPGNNWSQFRGNHQLTGVSQSNVPSSLKPLWTYEAGESIESSAAIVGSTVFVGSHKGELVALSLDNGSVYWKFSTGNPIGESSPAYGNGVVYIGDLGGWINAINASDGRKLWAFKTNNEIKSSPVVVGDRVLIGSYDEHLYCLSVRSGSLLWKFCASAAAMIAGSGFAGASFLRSKPEMSRSSSSKIPAGCLRIDGHLLGCGPED